MVDGVVDGGHDPGLGGGGRNLLPGPWAAFRPRPSPWRRPVDLDGIALPPEPELPEANLDWHNLPEPLVDSRWDFSDEMLALKEAKAFRR